jgi:hypothetical protein
LICTTMFFRPKGLPPAAIQACKRAACLGV